MSARLQSYPLKVVRADSVVHWWIALQGDVLALAIRGAHLESDGIQAVAAPVLLAEKIIGVFI